MKRSILWAHAGLVLALAAGAFAQSYPAKPVRIVVPFLAGGAVDTTARVLAEGRDITATDVARIAMEIRAEIGEPTLTKVVVAKEPQPHFAPAHDVAVDRRPRRRGGRVVLAVEGANQLAGDAGPLPRQFASVVYVDEASEGGVEGRAQRVSRAGVHGQRPLQVAGGDRLLARDRSRSGARGATEAARSGGPVG